MEGHHSFGSDTTPVSHSQASPSSDQLMSSQSEHRNHSRVGENTQSSVKAFRNSLLKMGTERVLLLMLPAPVSVHTLQLSGGRGRSRGHAALPGWGGY